MTMQHDERPRSIDVRLDALSETEWRVCDNRLAEDNHLSILGFIELRNGQFEVTTMSAPGERHVYDSLRKARAVFTASDRERVSLGNLGV